MFSLCSHEEINEHRIAGRGAPEKAACAEGRRRPDAELLAIFLRTGVSGLNCSGSPAPELLQRFGSWCGDCSGAEQQGFLALTGWDPPMVRGRRQLEGTGGMNSALSGRRSPRQVPPGLFCKSDCVIGGQEVFALLLPPQPAQGRPVCRTFSAPLDSASVYPREIVQIALKRQCSRRDSGA